jgi:hypothetical protein
LISTGELSKLRGSLPPYKGLRCNLSRTEGKAGEMTDVFYAMNGVEIELLL